MHFVNSLFYRSEHRKEFGYSNHEYDHTPDYDNIVKYLL